MFKKILFFSFFIFLFSNFSPVRAEEFAQDPIISKVSETLTTSANQSAPECYDYVPYVDENKTLYFLKGTCSWIYRSISDESIFQPEQHQEMKDMQTSFEKLLSNAGFEKISFAFQKENLRLLTYKKDDTLCYFATVGNAWENNMDYNIYTGCAEHMRTQMEEIYPVLKHLQFIGKEIGLRPKYTSDTYNIFLQSYLFQDTNYDGLADIVLVKEDSKGQFTTLYEGDSWKLPCSLHTKFAVPLTVLGQENKNCIGFNPTPDSNVTKIVEHLESKINPKKGYSMTYYLDYTKEGVFGRDGMSYVAKTVEANSYIQDDHAMEIPENDPNYDLRLKQAIVGVLQQTDSVFAKEGFKEQPYSDIRWHRDSFLKEYAKDNIICQVEYTFSEAGAHMLRCTDAVPKFEKILLPLKDILTEHADPRSLEITYKDTIYLTVSYRRFFGPGSGMVVFKRKNPDSDYHFLYSSAGGDSLPSCKEVKRLGIPEDAYDSCE